MKTLNLKQLTLAFAMLMGMAVCSMTLVSCSDDEPNKQEQKDDGGKDEQPSEDPEKNTTDVAVTGPVLEYGALYADIKGVVNLNQITASYSDVGFGVCISDTPDLSCGVDCWADEIVGRTIKAHFLLEPSTKYYYATFVNVRSLSYVYVGKTYSFTTKPINKDAAVTGSVSDIGAFSAKISGSTNPIEFYAADAEVRVGIEIADNPDFIDYRQIMVNEGIESFNVEVKSLVPNTKYYYQTFIESDLDFGDLAFCINGNTHSFTTKPINEDVVVTGDATDIGLFNAILSGSTNLKQFEDAGIKTSVGIELSEKDDFSDARQIAVTSNVEKFNVEVTSLSLETKYYYRTYLKFGTNSQENYYYGEKKSFMTKGLDNSNHYVDLGLPSGTLWATMNVGASKPEDYGDYFAWGEIDGYNSGKTTFNWSTYNWCNGDYDSMTKYCAQSNYGYKGFTDNKTELDPEDDVAYVSWGSGWRVPSKEQYEELINSDYTTTEWKMLDGVGGRWVVSKSNGNSIFLPAAGYHVDTSLTYAGSVGNYWSRTLNSYNSDSPWYLNFGSIYVSVNSGTYYRRYLGFSVRPVRNQ